MQLTFIISLTLASLNVFVKAFTLVPNNVGVAPRAPAVFRCQHLTADYVLWHINGTVLGRNPPPGITPDTTRDDDDRLVDTLTITARPEFNGTKVVCVAGFDDGREELSRPAFLLVGRFLKSPMSVNMTANTVAKFQCQNPAANGIDLKINGSTNFPENAFTDTQGSIYFLIITALPEYNPTEVTCTAYFDTSPAQETDPAVMRIQGCLESVTDLQRMVSTLLWEPPFSLDLTGVDPNIIYCVEVYNITCGERDLIISNCNVTESNYTSDDIAPYGSIYEYTVTPRSNVEGAKNGTNWTVKEQFYRLSIAPGGQQNVRENGNVTYVTLTLDIDNGGQEPLLFSALLNSADGIDHKNGSIEPLNIKRESNGQNIVLEVSTLPSKRVFDIMLLPNSCYGYPLTKFIEIGTHDVYAISVTVASSNSCVIQVMGDVVDGSSSLGILAIVYSHSLIEYDFVPHSETQRGVFNVTVYGVADDNYTVAIFVVEEEGKPFLRAASRPKDVKINGACEVIYRDLYVEYELHPTLSGVCITCTFLDSSATDCVAVVHQRISQLSSSGLMNIESRHNFTRSGDTAYGCIEGVNLEQHQVGVIGGKMIIPATIGDRESSQAGPITGVLIGIVVAVLVAVAVAVIVLYKRWKKLVVPAAPISHYSEIARPSGSQAQIIVNIEGGSRSAAENRYAESAQLSEEQPLLAQPLPSRMKEDGEFTPPGVESADHGTYSSDTADNATIERPSEKHPPPTSMDDGAYTPPVSDHAVAPPEPEPLTTDQLFSFLLPHAFEWQSLGEALSLDEDRLDKIFTNNKREEDCLREMLELYMLRSDLDHTWEEIQVALEKMESSSLEGGSGQPQLLDSDIHDSDAPTSVQESSQNSPVISGKTMVPDVDATDADSDHAFEEGQMEESFDTTAHSKLVNNCGTSAQPCHLTESGTVTNNQPRNSESGYDTLSGVSEPTSVNSEAGNFPAISNAKNDVATIGQLETIEEDREMTLCDPFPIHAGGQPKYELVTFQTNDENDTSV